ncbi:MAG: 1-acyl-sn-glycerol-3-phosphate acyltransferase [Deltaproteobacteria bacterium]|nr:1-acyl-sn-glycerol-3-phosphate acyltransferase [Deltaproteobacteria bacterium]
MNAKAKFFLHLQYFLGRITIIVTAPALLCVVKLFGYRIRNLKEFRRKVSGMMSAHKGPWLICANHLTMIDSVVLAYAMFPVYRYIWSFKLLAWNLPEKMNFNANKFVGALCYLTKCIPVIRGGDREKVKSSLEKCAYLLKKGQSLMIFPEGTRSRDGRVDTVNFPYGVGRLVRNIPKCRVMCIYLRGDGQKTYSNFPRYGETFSAVVEECRPTTQLKGLKAQRDCAGQIVNHLSQMEKNHFRICGK